MILLIGYSLCSFAKKDHQLIQRFALFPVEGIHSPKGEEAWWKAREELTKDKTFLVASRRHMLNREVFQPRSELEPADCIILSRLLDAHALITFFVKDENLMMKVYDGRSGKELWFGKYQSDSLKPLSHQVEGAVTSLVREFYGSIPYQGYVVKDPLQDGVAYDGDPGLLTRIFVGDSSYMKKGDVVYWLRILETSTRPLFQKGGEVKIHSEGTIVKLDKEFVIAKVKRTRDSNLIKENTLVNFPKEQERLRGSVVGKDLYILPKDMKQKKQKEKADSTTTSLAFLLTLASVLLLAF